MRRIPIDNWSNGMNRDLAVSKLALASNNEKSMGAFYEAKNIRFTYSEKEGTLAAITNEKSQKIMTVPLEGKVLGYAVIDNIIISFERDDLNTCYIVKYTWDEEVLDFTKILLASGQFDFGDRIDTVVSADNDLAKKVFWIDGKNPMRVINYLIKYGENCYKEKFDVLPLINDFPEYAIKKIPLNGGGFKSGTIQWCFTYINNLDCESNILDVTPLHYLSDGNKGSEKDALVSCGFELKFTNLDENFNRLILYSIERTSLDSAPLCRKVGIYNFSAIDKNTSLTIIDGGTSGEIIDPNELFFKNRELVIPKTFCVKDNTLFFGNYIKQSDVLDKLSITATTSTDNDTLEFNHLGLSDNLLNKSSFDITFFNPEETYRIGYQLQDDRGYWTMPKMVEDKSDLTFETNAGWLSTDGSTKEFSGTVTRTFPSISLKLDDTDESTKIKRARPLAYYPVGTERKVITTGVFFPTVFNINDRNNGNCWAYSSWYSRPQIDHNPDIENQPLTWKSSGLIFTDPANSYAGIIANPTFEKDNDGSKIDRGYDKMPFKEDSQILNKGVGVEFRHYKALPNLYQHNCEIMGHIMDHDKDWPIIGGTYNDLAVADSFFVDRSICSFYSPEIYNYSHGENISNATVSFTHKAPLLNSIPSINMVTEVGNFNNEGIGAPGVYSNLEASFNSVDYGWKTVVSGGYYLDYSSHLNASGDLLVHNISPWHVKGYLNNGGELKEDVKNSTYSFKRWCSYRISPYLESLGKALAYENINDIYAVHSDVFILPQNANRSQIIYKKNFEKILYSPGDVAVGGVAETVDLGLILSAERIKLTSKNMLQDYLSQYLVIDEGWAYQDERLTSLDFNAVTDNSNTITSIDSTSFAGKPPEGYFIAEGGSYTIETGTTQDTVYYNYLVCVYSLMGRARFDKDGIGNGYYDRNAWTIVYFPIPIVREENVTYKYNELILAEPDFSSYTFDKKLARPNNLSVKAVSLSNEGRSRYYFDYMASPYSGVFKCELKVNNSNDVFSIQFFVLGGEDEETKATGTGSDTVIGGRPYSILGKLTNNYRAKFKVSANPFDHEFADTYLIIPYRDWVLQCAPRPLWDYSKNTFLDEQVLNIQPTKAYPKTWWYRKVDEGIVSWKKVQHSDTTNDEDETTFAPKLKGSGGFKTYAINDSITISTKTAPHFVIDLYNKILPVHSESDVNNTSSKSNVAGVEFYKNGAVSAFKNNSISNKSDFGYLLVGNLLNTNKTEFIDSSNTELYKNQPWYIAGKAVAFSGNEATINVTQGDHFYTSHLILKCYPTGDDVAQGMTDIVEVPLLSRVNGAGRYDNNIGNYQAYWAKETTYGLINDAYSQSNNFFQFYINNDKETEYENYISWTLPKSVDYVIDPWTYQTLEAYKILNRSYGKLTKLVTLNSNIFAFQDSAINSINYNVQSLVTTDQGVPLEVGNNSTVADPVRVVEQVGCQYPEKLVTSSDCVFFADDYGKTLNVFAGNQLVPLSDKLGFHSWAQNNEVLRVLWDRKNQDVLFITANTALAFSVQINQFTSFYDYYYTDHYINLQNRGFTIGDTYDIAGEFKPNCLLGQQMGEDYQLIRGNFVESYIDTVVGDPSNIDKVYDIVEYNAISSSADPYTQEFYSEETPYINPICRIQAYNEYQDSKEQDSKNLTQRKFRIWRTLVPRDALNTTPGRIKNRIRAPWTHIKLWFAKDNKQKKLHNLKIWITD